jgi:hypothetical protein
LEVYLEHVSGERVGQVDAFEELDVIHVGRGESCQLSFEDAGVSAEHAELRVRNGALWVVDRGSTNGSFVNGNRARNSRLNDGDLLKFGRHGPELRFRLTRPHGNGSSEMFRAVAAPPTGLAPSLVSAPEGDRGRAPVDPARLEESGARAGVAPSSHELAPSSHDLADSEALSSLSEELMRPAQLGSSGLLATMGGLAMVGLLAWLSLGRWGAQSELENLRKSLEESRGRLVSAQGVADDDRVSSLEAQRRADVRIEELEQQQSDAVDRRKRLEASTLGRMEELSRALESSRENAHQLRARLERSLSEGLSMASGDRLRRVRTRYERTVVAIECRVGGRDDSGQDRVITLRGSGVFVNGMGHLVTTKHLVQPWLFLPTLKVLITEGITLDPERYQLRARWVDAKGVAHDASTGSGDLRLERVASGELRTVELPKPSAVRQVKAHVFGGRQDVALLRVTSDARSLPAVSHGERDMPLMVGDALIVVGRAPSDARALLQGELRLARSGPSLMVEGRAVGCGSGAPIFSSSGRVVALSSGSISSSRPASCIKIEHALKLLGGTW